MLRLILTVLCLTIGPSVLAATDGTTLLFDSDSSHVIGSVLQASMLDDLPRLAWFALAALFVVGLVAAQRKSTASLRRRALIWKTRCGISRDLTPRCKSKALNGSGQNKNLARSNASFS